MFCPYCGKEIGDMADVCLGCGREVKNKPQQDSASVGWWWLGFFFPMIGFILWCVWTGSTPTRAKRTGWGALAGIITSVALVVFIYVIMFTLIFMSAMHY